MLNPYENHLLNTYLANIVHALRHWSSLTPKLVGWLVDDWGDYHLIDEASAKSEHGPITAQRRKLLKRWEESETRKRGRVKSVSPGTFELCREIVLGQPCAEASQA